MNGSRNEELVLAINDERAAVISYIGSRTKVEENKERKQEKWEELHFFG